jgi:hypothetical protein
MNNVRPAVVVLLALAFSCAAPSSPGFDSWTGLPSDGGSVEAGASVVAHVDWHQDPYSEILQCHYLKLPNDAAHEIGHIKLTFPEGSHHVHVYHAAVDVPDHVENCTAIDWTTWSLVVGAQTKSVDWTLPEGVTVPLDPHEQLLVQVHWLNTTDQPIDRTATIELEPAAYSNAHLGVVFGVAKDVYMVPGQTKTVANWAPIDPGVNITAMMGHFHGRGTRYSVDLRRHGETSGTVVYQATNEQTFEFETFDPAPVPTDGQGLAFECDYDNTTTNTITWGANTNTQEHCNMAAYYYPATPPLSHLYLSGEIGSATVSSSQVVVGQSLQGHVELAEQAGQAGVDVELLPSSGLLPMPGTVHVAPWTTGADFQLQGMTSGAAMLNATTGSALTTIPITVAGLALSEVYYKPTGADPVGLQWVEIENIGDAPIDLSGYSLAAGGGMYGVTRATLGSFVLPPTGCLVVGGPDGLPASNPQAGVFTLSELFSPALTTVDTPANGVALYAVPLSQPLPAGATPLDAVVYGTANTNMLVGPDGAPATPVPGVAAGSSLERTKDWETQPTPTPGVCRVSHEM